MRSCTACQISMGLVKFARTHPFRRLTLMPPYRFLQSLMTNLRSPGVSCVKAMWDVMFVSTEDPLRKRNILKSKGIAVVAWRAMEKMKAQSSSLCG